MWNIYEYDIFIGEENYLSKGFGTKIITSVNNLIYNKYLAENIQNYKDNGTFISGMDFSKWINNGNSHQIIPENIIVFKYFDESFFSHSLQIIFYFYYAYL